MSETKTQTPGWFKSTLQRWLGTPIALSDGEAWAAIAAEGRFNGKPMTVDAALQLSTVWACVRLISETIATLPLGFYERMPDGSRRYAAEHPLHDLLRNQPNADMTSVQFWQAVIASMLLWGNAYVEKARVGKKIVALNFLLPGRVSKRRLQNGSIEYKYKDLDGKTREIAEADMMNIPAFSLDGINGLTPMSYGAKIFGSATATEEASAKVFTSGMRAAGFLKVNAAVDDKQREKLRANLQKFAAGGANAGSTMVLENGTDYQQLSMNPDDSQMLESRNFNVEEICRWFHTPPSMIGHGGAASNWGTGIEQQMIGFLTFSLRTWIKRVEEAIRKDLIEPAERNRFGAQFVIEGLLRADSTARAAFYASAAQNGWMTRNEIRSLENLPRTDGGDELTVQSNLIPLTLLGKITSTAGAAKAAMLNWLGLQPDGEKDET
jgi:HK97 family phage portal protein